MRSLLQFIALLAFLGCCIPTVATSGELNAVDIKEWTVPWEQSRPRDPFLDKDHRVWFVGQKGDYIGVFDPKRGQFHQFRLDPGSGPHNLLVDEEGFVWYAGNGAGHIGKLDPATGIIIKFPMPNNQTTDPHTLVFGNQGEIWFTVQHGNMIGQLEIDTGSILLTPLLSQNARPYGIVTDATHIPWFTEFGTNKLATLEPTKKYVIEIALPRQESRPRRLAFTSDGDLWYVDYAKGYLGRFRPSTTKVKEWRVPGGEHARPYGMTVDDQDRVWFVETGSFPNRLIAFNTQTEEFMNMTKIPSGGGTVRHMVYDQPTQTIWFGTDTNTIARVTLP